MSIAPSALPIGMRGIEKRFGSVPVLRDLNLDVEAGEFLTLLGPSGSGKTTLLMILAGFVRANAGSIRVGGDEIITTPPHKRNIGMVFQNYALFPHMNVFHNIAFPLKQRGVAAAETAERVEKALDLVKLQGLGERRIDQLSGGQRQRVALARAIVFEPRIVLMDEPLSALDKGLREHMQIELRALHRRLGMTTVYVTHDQREAITMSDRIAVMNAGRIEQLDKPETLYARPQTRFVAGFIGESNFIPVECRNGSVWYEDRRIHTAAPVPAAGQHLMVVRPEKLRLLADAEPTSGVNVLEAKVSDIIYQGDSFVCYAALRDGRQLTLRDYCRSDVLAKMPAPGQPVSFGLDAQDTILVAAD
ncbi:ABC transporter ATP-binding protein [Mesorhizobium sp. M7A.F.Ca.CA.001.09.2.1]|uniref:Spermidine/putrescine import ATP-binding protein PotA n=4 Tax=Mesorhizobium TaxID=68287 RepID=A0AB38TDZ7_9HYPH|nr:MULTISPECIES: ABC transporter ATP-binding protein [Mesorhizobium]RUY56497.1 ABC transporter ATP-binding protein [Mesorhizobium sp. M7A.F.Ca.CA.001.13.2.1]MDF3213384.1 ABC transporter ATP-binding protein [Mesorhizobium ciceri]RUY74621.1 ABC transporter ATP-binding protein [Mesorhizobium sp. M7A.F.Ca.CA.001.05.1.1]RUY81212.1 ABC transporter ATP-binding protein [Mesorhizobium sp. M7A.F.Ca.CA.001.09.2.1]RUZ08755.1 ABC transporter ATP-binding protein [Mesorhizobium sp. M7A.F.Ca.CA.001.04.2.1]